MKDVLISIKPQYANLIFNGTKHYEFRKKVPETCWPDRFYVYSSAPVKKIVGWFGSHGYGHYTTFDKLWEETGEWAGIGREDLKRYCATANEIFAIPINTFHRISPVGLSEIGLKSAPQNFCYLTPEQSWKLTLERNPFTASEDS